MCFRILIKFIRHKNISHKFDNRHSFLQNSTNKIIKFIEKSVRRYSIYTEFEKRIN